MFLQNVQKCIENGYIFECGTDICSTGASGVRVFLNLLINNMWNFVVV